MSQLILDRSPTGQKPVARERGFTLVELLDLPALQLLVEGWVELSSIGMAIFDEEGTKWVESGGRHGDLCTHPASREGHEICGLVLKDASTEKFESPQGHGLPPELENAVVVACPPGFCHVVVPICWEGEILGRVALGPLVTEAGPSAFRDGVPSVAAPCVANAAAHFIRTVHAMMAVGHRAHRVKELHWRSMEEAYGQLERRSAELQEMKAKLAELDRLKSSFLATVSHELRTPLTAIIGYSEMLNERLAGPLNREQAEYVRTILEKSEMLLKLISSILDVSEIEAKKVRLQFEWVEVADVVQSALLNVRPQANQSCVQIQADMPAQPVLVRADVQKLRQVVVNLLANAVKFTPKGGQVAVFLSRKAWQPELGAEGYRISVQDSGVGIPPDQFDKIFQSFYQVDSSFTRGFGGAGLGLAIVKSFVEAHGGVVRLESEVGRGSHFAAVLPAIPPISNGASTPCTPCALPDSSRS